MQGASIYSQLEPTCKGVAFNLRQTTVYYLWKDLPLSLAFQFVTYSRGKDRCSELAICSLLDSWISFYGPFCFKPFALPVRMKCGKGAIVPVSLRLTASSTNCAQRTAETWPSLTKKSFTEEGPLSFPTARWEMVFFLSVWLYGHTQKGRQRLWPENLSCLSKGQCAYVLYEHEMFTLGRWISVSGTFQSVPSFVF